MEDNRKEKLLEAGVDISSAMERFMGNEAMLVKFLKKFSADQNFSMLRSAMEEQRYEDAFKAAHTCKGLCGNLSLSRMFTVMSKEVEFLRSQNYPEAEALLPELVEEYDRTVAILDAL